MYGSQVNMVAEIQTIVNTLLFYNHAQPNENKQGKTISIIHGTIQFFLLKLISQ